MNCTETDEGNGGYGDTRTIGYTRDDFGDHSRVNQSGSGASRDLEISEIEDYDTGSVVECGLMGSDATEGYRG